VVEYKGRRDAKPSDLPIASAVMDLRGRIKI